jgi:hypothetical protein
MVIEQLYLLKFLLYLLPLFIVTGRQLARLNSIP